MAMPHFRAGVIIVVRRADGSVLAFERRDVPGQWQLPQGGIEQGETITLAAWRELREETGLDERHVDLVGEHEHWTVYAWPDGMRAGERIGQAHRWCFFDWKGLEVEPTPDGREFGAWRWMSPDDLIDQVIEFRRRPYVQVLRGG
ncbi:MAG TPA: NUDIX domain-containing protein [Ilumatobacter sp.]